MKHEAKIYLVDFLGYLIGSCIGRIIAEALFH